MARQTKPAHVPCSGIVATTGDWKRCTEQGIRRVGHFGIYCEKHAAMADRRTSGRGA